VVLADTKVQDGGDTLVEDERCWRCRRRSWACRWSCSACRRLGDLDGRSVGSDL